MTSDEFYTKVKGYMKVNPTMTYVIWTNPPEDADRQAKAKVAWLDYLRAKGLNRTASTWRMIWNGGGKAITAPTEDPCIYDLTYHPDCDAPRTSYGAHRQARDPSQPRQYRED